MRAMTYVKQRITEAISDCGRYKVKHFIDPNGYPQGHEAYVKTKNFGFCVDNLDQMPHEVYVDLCKMCGIEFC